MADGVDLFVDHYRAGRDTAVLVCPGFYQHRRTTRCRRIGTAIAAAGFDVLMLDLRGHGDSGGSYTFGAREPDDLRRVLDRVRPRFRRLEVLAFSMGAAIAIQTIASGFVAFALWREPIPRRARFGFERESQSGNRRGGMPDERG